MKTKLLIVILVALGSSTSALMAQDPPARPPADRSLQRQGGAGASAQSGPAGGAGERRGPGGGDRRGGPGGFGGPPPSPIVDALDLNHDGVIDADEIAKASESLKKLDKNGDGKLTPEEYRPARPGGAGGPGGPSGPDGQGGQGGERGQRGAAGAEGRAARPVAPK